jgi:hypothetical protein
MFFATSVFLTVLLLSASRQRLTIAGRLVEALLPRSLLQIVFLAATIAVFVAGK